MKYSLIFIIPAVFLISSCKKKDPEKPVETASQSFLPLQIGNYWQTNEENYIKIVDTVRISGELFYKASYLTGGDVFGDLYYRIDENQNLIEGSIKNPGYRYIVAKFSAGAGDSFQTLGDQSNNDYKVTVIEKTDTKMSFSYNMIYNPYLKDHPHIRSFIKGLGWADNWKHVKIDDRIYTF